LKFSPPCDIIQKSGEVIKLTPELQRFAKADTGFTQYCERYDRVASDPETRTEYYNWINEQIRQQGMLLGAEERGMKTKAAEIARNLLSTGLTLEQISKSTGLPLAAIKNLPRQ
jgi:hypothetical protein